MGRTDDDFGVIVLSATNEEIAARLSKAESVQECLSTEPVEFYHRTLNASSCHIA